MSFGKWEVFRAEVSMKRRYRLHHREPTIELTIRREATVDALSDNMEGATIDGSCTFDGDTVSPGTALSVASAPALEAAN